MPKANVPIDRVIKFREKRRDELLSFRGLMDEIYRKISEAKNEGELKEVMVQ